MMSTLLKISWTNLKRDRVAQMLAFLLPLIFFSIFATVFGNQANASTARIRVAIVDEDDSELSRRIVAGLRSEKSLRARTTTGRGRRGREARSRRRTKNWCAMGTFPSPSFFRKDSARAQRRSDGPPRRPHLQLLADVSDQIAPQMVHGLLQKVAMTSAPDILMKGGLAQFERYAGAMTPEQRAAVTGWLSRLTPAAPGAATPHRTARRTACSALPSTRWTSCGEAIARA